MWDFLTAAVGTVTTAMAVALYHFPTIAASLGVGAGRYCSSGVAKTKQKS